MFKIWGTLPGEIGELIGFNRALKDNEIKDTTNYLSAKWSEPAYVGVSCTNGTITASGCSLSEPGTSTTTVETGEGSLSCTLPGFSGTINYTCSDGVFSKTTSCSSPLCTITSVAGLNNKTNLPYAAIATAIPNTPTAACAAGYSGSPTYTCTATGAATITANCSPITCSITSVAGLNNKTNLAYAASATNIPATACAAGFSGSPTYTCTATGAATIVTNCSPITCSITSVTGFNDKTGLAYAASATNIPATACATGYSGSPTYTCTATGAATISGSCTAITCSITSVTGINNKTGLAYASSATAIPSTPTTACASGYTGSPTYTCAATGAATVVTNNCVTACNNNNGAGGTFNTAGLSTNSQYAKKACESKYGIGNCSAGSCSSRLYWYATGSGDCICSKTNGSYEWVYSNPPGSYTNYVGQDYEGIAAGASTAGINLFVRQKNANGCSHPSWSLVLSNLASGCPGITP